MTDYEELDAQLRAWLDEDELWAREASRVDDNPVPDGGVRWQWVSSDDEVVELDTTTMEYVDEGWRISLRSREEFPHRLRPLPQFAISSAEEVPIAVGGHIQRHDPAAVLTDITGKRALLDHVADWDHTYVDGDTWFSCSQAESPHASEDFGGPGSGCADEKRKGKPCDCGLDGRRIAVLRCVAAGYVERAGFKDEWRIGG